MLDELVERFGTDAVVTARPVMLESGGTYRWELEIDGARMAGVSAHVRRDPEDHHLTILLMALDDEEVEIARWTTKRSEPGSIVRTLGELRRQRRA
jgi:hypothetical protein